MTDASPWLFEGRPIEDSDLEGAAAFVYVITNLADGRRYVGKKRLAFRRKARLKKNQKRRKTKVVESDWREYFGSSNELLADVESLGRESFRREIVRVCKTLGESSYYEAKIQLEEDVLLRQDLWYNRSVRVRTHASHVAHLVK